MTTTCDNCPLRQLDAFQPLTEKDVSQMQHFKVGELKVEAGAQILMEGTNSPQLFTALHGMGLRTRSLPNGRRQVLNMIFPGDFIGLQAGVMGEMGHSVEATTAMTLCVFNRAALWDFFKQNPERAFDLTWLAAIEEHFLGGALTTLGQRTALQSLAWALSKSFARGKALGLVNESKMSFPFRQQDLADALGLSLVHTNKTLAILRKRQLAHWSEGSLRIPDQDALAALALLEETTEKRRPIL